MNAAPLGRHWDQKGKLASVRIDHDGRSTL